MESPSIYKDAIIEELKRENEQLKNLLLSIKEDLIFRAKMRGDVEPSGCVVVDLGASNWINLCQVLKEKTNVSKS